jgi:hypothetical protein
VAPALRLIVVAGRPVEFFRTEDKELYGASLDILPSASGWSTNLFAVEQRVAGVTDRRAVGSEVRYFDERRSLFGLVDYDVSFAALNVAMLQANLMARAGTSYTLLLDHRRVPALQLTNAFVFGADPSLPATPGVSQALASGQSLSAIKEQALASTPVSDLFMAGVMHPVTPAWQLGGDFRIARVSATTPPGGLPPLPATSARVWTAQAIRTGVFATRDSASLSGSLIDGDTYRGSALSLSHVYAGERWRTETVMRYYHQQNDQGATLARITPALRVSYRLHRLFALEAEVGQETTTNLGPLQDDRTLRRYFSVGYRWDFL